jgi:cyclopropane-fatty-acyl-phospholipid synthase
MASSRLEQSPDLSPRPPGLAPDHTPVDSGTLIGRFLARLLARNLRGVPVELVLPDGARALAREGPPIATVTIRDHAALPGLILNPDLAFGRAFESGRVEIAGDLVGFLEAVYRRQAGPRLAGELRDRVPSRRHTSLRAARRDIHRHYDLGNDFYRLWLDPEMLYTCAYYPSPSDDLDRAQVAKMDLVCRKLGLRAGERVVEAGCG